MFKRQKSYLLLTFLVLTGFGGRIHSDALPGKERNALIRDLKEGRKDFFESLEQLDPLQLDFRASSDQWTIREHIYHLALCEDRLWNWTEKAMDQFMNNGKPVQTIPFKRLSAHNFSSIEKQQALHPSVAIYRNMDEAIDEFKSKRARIIKFVRTTTDDIRSCNVDCPLGDTDTYQLLLYLSNHTDMHISEIETIKTNPNFPK